MSAATPEPTAAHALHETPQFAAAADTPIVASVAEPNTSPATVPEDLSPLMTATATTQTVTTESPASEQQPAKNAEEGEPQNDLTQKFTEVEWKAVKELRVSVSSWLRNNPAERAWQSQLPDIFAEAYPEQSKARETPVNLWGVMLDPVNSKSDARVSVILMKFLRARFVHF